MGVIDHRQFTTLMNFAGAGPCVSLFLPTHRGGRDVRQAPIRLKNLLQEAEEQLAAFDMKPSEIEEFLEPIINLVGRHSYWEHQLDGLALFKNAEQLTEFRCPRHFDELCYVNDHFHLKPLLPLLRGETAFHLLALSLKKVQLFEVTTDGLNELVLEKIPASLEEALGHEIKEPTLQHHAGGRPGPGSDGTIFHGHGAGSDDRTAEVVRFLQLVDQGLRDQLQDNRANVVVAGVEELVHRFHDLSKHPGLIPGGVTGNPASLDRRRLHSEAWSVARPVLEADAERVEARFRELSGTERASAKFEVVGPAVAAGRVESLLVSADRLVWGRLLEDGTPEVHPQREQGDVELLDRLAVLGLQRGAEVVARRAARLPEGVAVAAVMRY
jgi:hypothetical protein